MLKRILASALIAGFAAGVVISGLQRIQVVPIILEAETHIGGGEEMALHSHEHATAEPAQGTEPGAPEEGLQRTLYTLLANIVTAIGFAFLLTACYALKGDVDARQGLLWGLAGFAVFQLAPSLGLAPEIPGSFAAALYERQVWWLATVAATASGLALVVFHPGMLLKGLGIGLILFPHVVGAPQPEAYGGSASPELAARFTVAALFTTAVFWIFLGGTSGFLFHKMAEKD